MLKILWQTRSEKFDSSIPGTPCKPSFFTSWFSRLFSLFDATKDLTNDQGSEKLWAAKVKNLYFSIKSGLYLLDKISVLFIVLLNGSIKITTKIVVLLTFSPSFRLHSKTSSRKWSISYSSLILVSRSVSIAFVWFADKAKCASLKEKDDRCYFWCMHGDFPHLH